jgi:hypothetical protein
MLFVDASLAATEFDLGTLGAKDSNLVGHRL